MRVLSVYVRVCKRAVEVCESFVFIVVILFRLKWVTLSTIRSSFSFYFQTSAHSHSYHLETYTLIRHTLFQIQNHASFTYAQVYNQMNMDAWMLVLQTNIDKFSNNFYKYHFHLYKTSICFSTSFYS